MDGIQPSCNALGQLRSDKTRQKITVTFVNRTNALCGVMWLNHNGRPVTYANLAAGRSYTANTYRNDIWMFTDGPGNCIETYLVRNGATMFEITAPNQVLGPKND